MSDKLKPAPTMAWDPATGASKIYPHPSEVPEGHLDSHPDNKHAKPVNAPAVQAQAAKTQPDMTKAEIIAALTAGGVQFNQADKASVLYAQLTDAVKKALDEAGISYDASLPTKQLLDLLPEPE